MKNTTQQVVHKNKLVPPNPNGKGGFGDNPQNQSPGGWKKENTISYQYSRFINMTPNQLKDFAKLPDDEKTMAMVLAFNRVLAANKSLPDMKEITDRTEGKSKESVDLTSGGEAIVFGNIVPRNKKED